MDYDFKKYWKLPFRYDKYGWIYDAEYIRNSRKLLNLLGNRLRTVNGS